MPILPSIGCLAALTGALALAALAYNRLLDRIRGLQPAPARYGAMLVVYTAFSLCLVAALVAVIRLDLFGLDTAGAKVHATAELASLIVVVAPALALVRRRDDSG